MSDNLSMSQFSNKEDFLRAKADLARQESEIVTASVTPQNCTVTRLVSGVELKMVASGKHWHFQARKIK